MKPQILVVGLLLFGCAQQSVEGAVTASVPTYSAATADSTYTMPVSATAPAGMELEVTDELINCRFGPGTVYELRNEFPLGQSLRAVGRNESSTWWYVQDPGNPGGFCWVSAGLTRPHSPDTALPVAPPPFVTVTSMDLKAEPDRMVVGCDQFPRPVFFEAKIKLNGPASVKWKWDVSSGDLASEGVMAYEASGIQIVNEYYLVTAPGDYFIKFIILAPNALEERLAFRVTCTP